jgi:DNA repair exonuclease SbcCD ATPase subunit
MLNNFFTVAFIFICSVNLFANVSGTPGSQPGAGGTPQQGQIVVMQPSPTSDTQAKLLRCDNFAREFREQMDKYIGYCNQAGGNGTDCGSLIESCREEVRDLADGVREARGNSESMRMLQSASQSALQSENGFASMLGAFGSSYANPERMLSSVQGKCPSMGSRDYNTSYREIKNDIKDTKKRITEEGKEILKKQTDLETDQQAITKDTTKAKEKYEKAKIDMEQKRQSQAEKHFENTQKAQKTLGEIETRALRLNLEYQRVLQDESSTTLQYLAYAEKNITASCKAQVQKQRAELFPVSKGKQQSSNKLIAKGKELNSTLQNLFNSCYAAQDQKLKTDLQEKKNKKLETQDAIKKMEEEKQRITEAVANADDSLKKLGEVAEKEIAQNEQSYMDEINNLQQRLQTAAGKFDREQKRSTQELNQLNTELQTSQVELAGLGPKPSGDSESVGLDTANRSYERANGVAKRFVNEGCSCPDPDEPICRAGNSSTRRPPISEDARAVDGGGAAARTPATPATPPRRR